jgi:site-specific DNA-cytosine methylase
MINVLSLFDGISCGQMALKKLDIPINKYYASEVDKHAIRETMANFPNTIQLGDIRNLDTSKLEKIDLIFGGSPCQSFSMAGKRVGMSTTENVEVTNLDQYLSLKENNFTFSGQSYLFWEYVRILKEVKPKYFLLENVVMAKKWEDIITNTLGVEPIKINSALVSAQNRVRLYWTNILGVIQPEDKGIKLSDILEDIEFNKPSAIRGRRLNKACILGRRLNKDGIRKDNDKNIPITQCLEVRATNTDKSNCITTVAKDNVLTPLPIGRHFNAFKNKLPFRYYTVKEYCRLQTIPEDYFKLSSESQIRKMIGNGWTIDVISHILKNIIY